MLIGLSGKKQSGKTTLSNFIHGHEMKRHDVIQNFEIDNQGNLIVNYVQFDEQGKEDTGMAVFDLWQYSDQFIDYAQRFIWPLIKGYNFADALKELCINLFDIPYECLYGTNEHKNKLQEHLRWENMPGVISKSDALHLENGSHLDFTTHEPGPMTAREFMQYFGTDIMRKTYQPVWINNCMKRIEDDQSPIAIVSDCRFTNEIEAVQSAGGKVIRLTRNPFDENHSSETEVDDEDCDAIINNTNMTIDESCNAFLDILVDLGATQKIRAFNHRKGMTTVK